MGKASGTTRSAVAPGTILVRDASQPQDIAQLSRDTSGALGSVADGFTRSEVEDRLAIQKEMTSLGVQAMGAYGENKKREAETAAAQRLSREGVPAGEMESRIKSSEEVRQAEANYGPGSAYWTTGTALTAALSGGMGGNLSGAVSGAAAPYLANLVKGVSGGNEPMRVALHTVLGAFLAQSQGGSVSGGALGGFTASAASGLIAKALYPEAHELTVEQKQLVANLVMIAGAGVGGVAGGNLTAAGSAANTAKNETENNFLSADQIEDFAAKAKGCEARGDCKQIVKEMEDLSLEQQKEIIAVCSTSPEACKEKYGDIPANGMLVREAIDRVLGDDVPSKMKNDMSSLLAQQIEAEGVVSSTEFANRLQSIYGIDKQQAEILAGAALGAITGGMGKGAKPTAGAAGKNVVVVDSGKKGGWSKTMNKPEPNTVYEVDGNKTYHTDELSRTTNVSASLSLSKNDRNTYQQCKAGKCGNTGDEGGHLIASIFNGPGEKLNLVPMDGNLNKGAWKQMENTWANALKDGKAVDVNIQPMYSGNNTRPDRVIVQYSIDGGRPVNVDFKNSPGGK